MLDRDLAELYGVPVKRLNEQVKRNQERFPQDFMFRPTLKEGRAVLASRSQIATLNRGQNIKYLPYVFTEHGAVMLANVLKSVVAVRAGIQVVRAFVRLRRYLPPASSSRGKSKQWRKRLENTTLTLRGSLISCARYWSHRHNRPDAG